jgi:primosomal protein N' (replication factor Y)
MTKPLILQIAIPKPLYTHFDYLAPTGIKLEQLHPGMRLRVPFGTRTIVGLLLNVVNTTNVPANKLKMVLEFIDLTPVLPENILSLLQWASSYYHHPIGEVISTALPKLLNQGKSDKIETPPNSHWFITAAGKAIKSNKLPKQQQRLAVLLSLLQQNSLGLNETEIALQLPNPRPTLQALKKREWISHQLLTPQSTVVPALTLNVAQEKVVNQVSKKFKQFYPCLLDGVTGSGKTEVYLQIIQKILDDGKQALVLIPEINLTPQTLIRFKERFAVPIAIWHSKLNDIERLHTWLLARDGIASIIIGTRSAVWIPLARPGIFIVDEEHDQSYKQQDHFRYSARDIAIMRAKRAKVPILLGTATPSLDTLHNALTNRYQHLILPERAGSAIHPTFHIIDMRQQSRQGLSQPLKKAIDQHLAASQQILLFINRRGYAPVLMCYKCGWIAGCEHCDARLTFHDSSHHLQCHHCGDIRPLMTECPECGYSKLGLLGQGTERIEEDLQKDFPSARVLRIDSDSTRNKYSMHTMLERIYKGEVDILVGTQMLAKGHHFPKVTLVGVINIDSNLYGVDFRSTERMGQLLMQVSGRAGRADKEGEVLIQTYHPEHPLLIRLIKKGYAAFANAALKEREQAGFPPYSRMALLRAEATDANSAIALLQKAKNEALALNKADLIQIWGPVPAPMEKRAKWYRAQLLLLSSQREALHNLLNQWLPKLPTASTNKLRWSLDVDPQDLL